LIERARGEAEANRLWQASITPQHVGVERSREPTGLIDRWSGNSSTTALGETNWLMPFPGDQR